MFSGKQCFTGLISTLLFCFATQAIAQTRGVGIRAQTGENIRGYKASYALLIGVSDYVNGWPDLGQIPDELDQVENALISNGFDQVIRVKNPNNLQLKGAFEKFINDYGYDEDNRLLVFYSGHGYTRDNGKKGYLVPADAPDPTKNERGFLQKAFTMTDVLNWARKVESRHALFLFDSCFSGTVFESRALPSLPPLIQAYTAKPVRQFITAGSAGQEVPAKSVFTPAFIRALRGEGDLNKDGYVTGSELGMYISDKVANYDNGSTTPQYGKIRDPELDEGDFVFAVTGHDFGGYAQDQNQNTDEDSTDQQLSLYIETSPINARIRLLNGFGDYRNGLKLDLGRYEIEVSEQGYETQRKWLLLSEKQQKFHVTLARKPTLAAVSLPGPAEFFDAELNSYDLMIALDKVTEQLTNNNLLTGRNEQKAKLVIGEIDSQFEVNGRRLEDDISNRIAEGILSSGKARIVGAQSQKFDYILTAKVIAKIANVGEFKQRRYSISLKLHTTGGELVGIWHEPIILI